MGQESVAWIALMRWSRVSGCAVTALLGPTWLNESGAIQRQVSQLMQV